MCVFIMHGATNKNAYLFGVISFCPPFLCFFPPAPSSSNFPSIIPKLISQVCVSYWILFPQEQKCCMLTIKDPKIFVKNPKRKISRVVCLCSDDKLVS